MKIDRKVIKSQAKQLISGNVLKLFVIVLVITALTGGIGMASSGARGTYNKSNTDKFYSDDSGNFGNNSDNFNDWFNQYENGQSQGEDGNPIESFGGHITAVSKDTASTSQQAASTTYGVGFAGIAMVLALIFAAAAFVLSALTVSFDGYFIQFVRTAMPVRIGNALNGIFKTTFSDNYWRRLGLVLLRDLFKGLLMLVFIVPGVIYHYSTYFATQIMNDHPMLSPFEACDLSRKMVRGHRTELFVLDLSYIGWFILMSLTCGLVGIYVMPYYYTVKALYYQNFLSRAYQTNVLGDKDFVSDKERQRQYAAGNFGYNYNYTTNGAQQNQQGYAPQQNYGAAPNYNPPFVPQYQPAAYQGAGTAPVNPSYPNQQYPNQPYRQYAEPQPQSHMGYADTTYYQPPVAPTQQPTPTAAPENTATENTPSENAQPTAPASTPVETEKDDASGVNKLFDDNKE